MTEHFFVTATVVGFPAHCHGYIRGEVTQEHVNHFVEILCAMLEAKGINGPTIILSSKLDAAGVSTVEECMQKSDDLARSLKRGRKKKPEYHVAWFQPPDRDDKRLMDLHD